MSAITVYVIFISGLGLITELLRAAASPTALSLAPLLFQFSNGTTKWESHEKLR